MSHVGEGGSVRESLEKAVIEAAEGTDSQVNSSDVSPEVLAVPESWADEDKAVWNEKITDPEARKWLLGREEKYTKQIGELTPIQEQYKPFQELFEPHAERMKASGQTPAQVTKNLLDAQMVLEQKPIDGMLWLVKQYGIDVKALMTALGGGEQSVDNEDPLADLDPKLKAYIEKSLEPVKKFEETTQAQMETEHRRIAQETGNAITEFRSSVDDKTKQPLYPHLGNKEVANRMSLLIKTGEVDIAKAGGVIPALKDAYDQACRSVPGVRDDYLKALMPKTEDTVTKERLLAAKRAGVGLGGSGGSLSSPAATGSLRETLKGKMEQSGLFTP